MKVDRTKHRALAIWAAECAGHVQACFEKDHPDDPRPREAIEACREWARTGVFSMAVIRKASLSAHAAARACEPGSAEQFAARAAGQAVATAHVASHAIGAAWYAVKAADAAGANRERAWQYRRLPEELRPFILHLAREKPVLAKALRYPGMDTLPRT